VRFSVVLVYRDLMRMKSRMTCAICLVQIRVLNDEEAKDADPTESETDDVFLRKIEATLLTQVSLLVSHGLLQGEVFIREAVIFLYAKSGHQIGGL